MSLLVFMDSPEKRRTRGVLQIVHERDPWRLVRKLHTADLHSRTVRCQPLKIFSFHCADLTEVKSFSRCGLPPWWRNISHILRMYASRSCTSSPFQETAPEAESRGNFSLKALRACAHPALRSGQTKDSFAAECGCN